jgi:hypothetical protein
MRTLPRILFSLCAQFKRRSSTRRPVGVRRVRDDSVIEPIEAVALLLREAGIGGDGGEQAGGQRSVDAFEELQEDEADRVALRQQAVAAAVWQTLDQAFGAELRQVVPEGRETVLVGRGIEGGGWRLQVTVVKVSPAAKRTRACMRASCRG